MEGREQRCCQNLIWGIRFVISSPPFSGAMKNGRKAVGLEKFPVCVFRQVTHLDVELRKASPDVQSGIGQKQGWLVLFSFKMHLRVPLPGDGAGRKKCNTIPHINKNNLLFPPLKIS